MTRRRFAAAACAALLWSSPGQGQTDPFSRSFPDGGSAPRIVVMPAPICFPPAAPPIGRPAARNLPATTRGRPAAPEELAAFVNEPFYPQLSTRILTKTLSDKQRQELERYRTAKRAAQAELRAELERLRDAEPAVRRRELGAFAQRQTPRIAQLEATAEKLRTDLIASGKGWDDLREWHLADPERRGFSPVEIAQVMRSYAFYRPGLSAGQRRLLREISLELLFAADSTEKATANQPHVFFQPELARVMLPDSVSPQLAVTIANYQSRKAHLKKELFEAVRSHDGAKLGFFRNPLRAQADKHNRELAELERLAESIRVGLAEEALDPLPAERSPLPPTLTDRLVKLLHDRDQAERETTAKLDEIIRQRRMAPARVSYRIEADGVKFVVIPFRSRLSEKETEAVTELSMAISEVADFFGRRIAELINERDAIRREAGEVIGSKSVGSIDAALVIANRVAMLKQNESAQRDYRVAAFEPGLSSEQRRLLFDAAIEDMKLVLPRAEMQPTRRAGSW